MKNKVTVISNMYPSREHKSWGIFVKNQVEALRNKGLIVDVIAIDNPNKGKLNLLKKYGKWFLTFALHLLFKGSRTSVVHAHYVFPSGMLAKWYKKWFGARMIVTAHGGDIDKMVKKNHRIYSMTKSILVDADQVIAVGEELYATLEEDFGVPREKLSLINMGVNLDVFRPIDKKEARERCGINTNQTPLLFVGNIIEQKGLNELVEAFSMLKKENPNYHLYIIGSNKDQNYFQKLQSLIKELGMTKSIHLLGTKSQAEVACWMAAADVFILPSHIEGFGLVAVEAMACGTPVVGTNVGGLKYLLNNENGVLVEVNDVISLKKGIESVLLSEEVKEKLVRNGLVKAQENDQNTMTDRVMNLYQSQKVKGR
ncbi:glycosyltransferase [Neobacillus sp. PS2-9]|uniref:glycosyltransferase n=1 Tax=Neobacillus sp. PS2-9 TaxID=3070676 RepID=UPI0027E1F1AE|nr:glycosyltransferase [Neobacillus sp. PS2-9]WML59042.1 glycosyltransferase [Neobacillus sp. PS2-9]